MGKSTSKKVRVGIFVVVGTLLLIIALYFIGARQHIFSKNIKIYAFFENVKGLQMGNNVRYSGINVGTVTKIEMIEESRIRVQMSIEEKEAHFIKKNAIASITSDGLVGSMVMNITPGTEPEANAVLTGDTIQSYNSVDTDEMLATLSSTNDNVAVLSSKLLLIVSDMMDGQGALGSLVYDTIIAKDIRISVQELKKTTVGASQAIARINDVIAKINYDESAAAVLLSDTESADQIRNVFNKLEKSSQEIFEVSQNLNEYMEEIRSGDGVINHLTQDQNLVNDLDTTMTSIKEASEKLNQNMEALKHNFLFRGYFRKQDRKEKKEAKKED